MSTRVLSAFLVLLVAGGGVSGCKTPDVREEPAARTTESPPREFLSAAEILISYQGARRAAPDNERTAEEARRLAEELTAEAKEDPSRFAELARRYSDGPTAADGGNVPVWIHGKNILPHIDRAVYEMEAGEIAGPVESPFGLHIVARRPLPPMLAARHILVAYEGAEKAKPEVTRSKEEARRLAEEICADVRAAPERLAELAAEHSDGQLGRGGGDLGQWPKGFMDADFEAVVESLDVGEISDPAETPFGFHVVLREEPGSPSE